MTPQTIATVKATVPVLQARGEDITRHFYQLMFREHPEVKAFFNEAHQAAGLQARALANAVLAYAMHIDRLEAIAPALPLIVQKHAALGVLPEHYPIVGKCLLQAIREVLGEAATDEVIGAWGEAYGALAQILIEAEEAVYADNAARPGGWRGERRLRVARRKDESEAITSFYLEPVDGQPLMAFKPGQYLTIVLNIDGDSVRRNYSLSDAPGKPHYRISVKREPDGRVSNWLHAHAQPGTELQALAPCGDLHLDLLATGPMLLVTGGVGITPAISILEASAPTGRPIRFLHAARHAGVHAFRERVEALAAEYPNVSVQFLYDEPRPGDPPHRPGRVTRALLAEQLPADRQADIYLIGPTLFMRGVYADAIALGVPKDRLRYEFFGPLEAMMAAA